MPTQQLAADLCRALATEMREVQALIEAIGEVLIADEGVASRFVGQLQNFDLLAQTVAESAGVLDRLAGGDCVHSTVDQVRLERMQARLRAVLRAA